MNTRLEFHLTGVKFEVILPILPSRTRERWILCVVGKNLERGVSNVFGESTNRPRISEVLSLPSVHDIVRPCGVCTYTTSQNRKKNANIHGLACQDL
jgi:hypothetical protein